MRLALRRKLLTKLSELFHPGDRFLILVEKSELRELEENKRIYLGSKGKANKVRPAIVLVEEERGTVCYKLLFLTASQVSPLRIDLRFCPNKHKLCRDFIFYDNSYLFFERKRGYFFIKLKTLESLGKFKYCGKCENLEIIEKISVVEL